MKIKSFKNWEVIIIVAGAAILSIIYFKASSPHALSIGKHEKHSNSYDKEKGPAEIPPSTEQMPIHYQGRTFLVDRKNPDYNVDQADVINGIITNLTPPEQCESYKSLMEYYRTIKCPGFGSSTGGFGEKTPLGQFTFISVEIPKTHRFRIFVYHRQGDEQPYNLIDDFYYNDNFAPLLMFVVEGRRVSYFHQTKGILLRTTEIM